MLSDRYSFGWNEFEEMKSLVKMTSNANLIDFHRIWSVNYCEYRAVVDIPLPKGDSIRISYIYVRETGMLLSDG